MRRKRGRLLPIEERILSIAAKQREDIHGFALASRLASEEEATNLIGHGTLYKALDRLRKQGLLEARWEDPEAAERERRPRRRLYRITDAGRVAVMSREPSSERVRRTSPGRAST